MSHQNNHDHCERQHHNHQNNQDHDSRQQQPQDKRQFQGRQAPPQTGRELQHLFRFGLDHIDEEDHGEDHEDDDHGGDHEDDDEADDDILQHRGSRGSAPIQVIITRRPRPKVTYVSLLQQNDQSQLQESKV